MNATTRSTSPVDANVSAYGACDNERSGTGRCANTDPLLDRINLVEEGSGPVHIVPKADSTATTPPKIAHWMSRADGCPSCVMNTEPPREVKATADGWLAAYLCNDCGHAWLTSWKD